MNYIENPPVKQTGPATSLIFIGEKREQHRYEVNRAAGFFDALQQIKSNASSLLPYQTIPLEKNKTFAITFIKGSFKKTVSFTYDSESKSLRFLEEQHFLSAEIVYRMLSCFLVGRGKKCSFIVNHPKRKVGLQTKGRPSGSREAKRLTISDK